MQKRKLGKTSLMVSPISIGCWSFGGGSYWGSQDQKDVDEVVHAAIDRGINLFDTAEAYNDGASEESLGKALKNKRDKAIIVTKQVINSDKDDTIERFESQLKRLGTDYLDILMIHWPNDDEKIMERVFESYEKLKKSGKVREFGISNFGIQQMKTAKNFGFDACANELHYNIASRAIDKYIKPSCIENSIGIITYVSLQQGLLTGKYKNLADIAPIHARYKHFKVERSKGLNNHGGEGAEDELISLLENMQLICEEKNITMIELSLGWALRQPGITSTIVGCRNMNQLVTNLKGADIKIDDELNEYLIKLSDPLLLKLGYSPDYISPISRIK